jgi:MraZ protein
MDADSQPQKFFAGEFRHSLDEKNRLTIPSRWRSGKGAKGDKGEEFIIWPEQQHQYLVVMSTEEFARVSAQAEAEQSISAQQRRIFSRQFHARADHALSDRHGRLVLPEDLCKAVGLKGEVALVGGRGRFEIWNLQKWKRAHDEETPTYQHIANVIGL